MIGGGPRPGGACSTAEKREREGKIHQEGGRNSCHRKPVQLSDIHIGNHIQG